MKQYNYLLQQCLQPRKYRILMWISNWFKDWAEKSRIYHDDSDTIPELWPEQVIVHEYTFPDVRKIPVGTVWANGTLPSVDDINNNPELYIKHAT